jgi:hypothetical protein
VSYRTGDTTARSAFFTRTIRRTVLAGAGVAMVLGIAVPASAASAGTAAKPTPAAASTFVPFTHAAMVSAPAQPTPKPGKATPQAPKLAPKPVNLVPRAKTVPLHKPAPKPTMAQLETHGRPKHQVSLKATASQMANARAIIKTGQDLKLPPRAWVIALATSMQETHLKNYGNLGHRNDHDSLGLFQQRPSSGWGSPAQIVNPHYAATKFYKALVHVKNWNKLPLTVAAQKVQVSAFGDRYAKWESQAASLIVNGR